MRVILAVFVFVSTIVFTTTAPSNQTHDSGTTIKDGKPGIKELPDQVSESINTLLNTMMELFSSVLKLSASGNGGSKSRQAEWGYEGITKEVTGMHLIENFLKNVRGKDVRQEYNDKYYGKPKKIPVEPAPCTRLFSWCGLRTIFGGK